jgi:transposase
MRYSIQDKLKIVKEHITQNIAISELVQKYHISRDTLNYCVTLYKMHGEKAFENHGTNRTYTKEFKLKAIDRVLNHNETHWKVALDCMLTDRKIIDDWIEIYKAKGPDGIKDTHSRSHYLIHEERLNVEANKKLLDRLEYLEAENEYLKKLYALAQEKKSHKKKK